MKHKIKKNKLKIFIALSLMITCIFGVMFATNTFAYESVNTISDTLTLYEEDFSSSTCLNRNTYLQDGYIDVRVNNNSGYITYVPFTINDTNFVSQSYLNYCVIINCIRINQNGVITDSTASFTNSLHPNVNNTGGTTYNTTYYNLITKNNIQYKTLIYNLGSVNTFTTNVNYNGHKAITLGFRGSSYQSSDTSWQGIRIYNIDFIKYEDIYTSKYIDDIETQYNQLLEDYNELEDNYTELNDNYTQLESNYNDLQDNYDNLETNYEDLDNKLKNLYFNTNYGIWDFLAYEEVAIFEPNYSSTDEYYRYEGITNWVKYNDVLEMNKLNITNAITRYWSSTNTPPYTINCDSWAISMYFSVPNNVSYIYYEMPLDVLDLFIDTNISFNNIVPNENVNDYLAIDIRLSNYDNYSYGNFIDLDISRDFLNQYGFKITKENLQQYFSQYDLNYYNNIMSITIGSNYKLSTTDKFNIISSNAVIDRNYQLGFIDGQASMDNTIRGLKVQISDLNGTISQLQLVIDTLNGQVDTLTNGYDLNNLMWTIGSVPFESFKQIWNVNFFGVNLADFFLGFVTFFVALFVVKKFFL